MNYKNIVPAKPYVDRKLKKTSIRVLFEEERTKTEIARMIRAAREKAGMSQRELARKAKTTQGVVGRLEAGTDPRMPSLMLISKLLKATNAHLEIKCVFDRAA